MKRRLACSVATEDLPKQVEEPDMEAPKEIFLKDYRKPDYYFDTVSQELFSHVTFEVLQFLNVLTFPMLLRMLGINTGGSEIFLGQGVHNSLVENYCVGH